MLIPLDDEIWSRLYGPYGLQDVAGILEALKASWDEETAQDLFWEKLHHQDDLYPVTYAALPWLWEMRRGQLDQETALFLSHAVHCAVFPRDSGIAGIGARGKFNGLSLRVVDHQKGWLNGAHLTQNDLLKVKALEDWLDATKGTICKACLALVAQADGWVARCLTSGFLALRGAWNAEFALDSWPELADVEPMTVRDIDALKTLWKMASGQNAELDACLAHLLGDDLPNVDQMEMPLG